MRRLVVNADDFGLSAGVNRGIVAAHEDGIVTSASLMVHQPAAEEAAWWARAPAATHISVGLHVDLGEWRPGPAGWQAHYQRAALDDADAISAEVDTQLARFVQLVGQPPTHLDSHQHVHRESPVREVLADRAARLGVPLRDFSGVRHVGGFYGQDETGRGFPELLTAGSLIRLLSALGPGSSELGCHPGYAEDTDSIYRDERRVEVAVLCDPAVRTWLEGAGIALCRFEPAA